MTRNNLRFTTDQFELNRGDELLLRVAQVEGQVRVFQEDALIGKANIPADPNVAKFPPHDDRRSNEASDGASLSRQAALAVLKIGGRVEVKTQDSEPRWIERGENLPPVPFSIEWIEVHRDRAEPITPDWLRDVLAGATGLDGIALHEQALGDQAMPLLAQSGSLGYVMMSDVGITNAGLASLASLPLVQLNVGKNRIGDQGIRALGTPAKLKLLVLTEAEITDEALRHIASWPQLQSLLLASTAITDRGLAHLEKLTSLREIDLDGTQVTREGVNRFRSVLPRCRITSEFDPGVTCAPPFVEQQVMRLGPSPAVVETDLDCVMRPPLLRVRIGEQQRVSRFTQLFIIDAQQTAIAVRFDQRGAARLMRPPCFAQIARDGHRPEPFAIVADVEHD